MRKLRAKRLALSIVIGAGITACEPEEQPKPDELPARFVSHKPVENAPQPERENKSEEAQAQLVTTETPDIALKPLMDESQPVDQKKSDADATNSGVLKTVDSLSGEAGAVKMSSAMKHAGIGAGTIGGLGKVDTGGGKGTGGRIGKRNSIGAGGLGLRGVGRGGGGIANFGTVGYGRGRAVGVSGKSSYGVSGSVSSGEHTVAREGYTDYGTNSFIDPTKDRLSTFAVDVDTGSYTIARRKLNQNTKPNPASVRVEEFVNYFDYGYQAPKQGAFSVSLEAAPSPFSAEPNMLVVRVGVQGKKLTKSSRKPVHLTFLVDVSGSMRSQDKIGFAKQSLKILTRNLQADDTVAIATYAGRVAEILPPTGAQNQREIFDAIDNLQSGGSTAMNDGLKLAYNLAMRDFDSSHVNRVVVLSDGDANVGRSTHKEILQSIHSHVEEGVTLSTIGFGMGNYKDTMMEQLANKGNGNYYYIDSLKESQKVFGEQLDGTLQVIAKDVKIQVDFEPNAVASYRLIGYENRDIADKDFRNDRVDAGEIGAGHSVTALYEVKLKDANSRIATVRIRHKKPQGAKALESEFILSKNDIRASVGQSSKSLQFATAVAGFAEILRGSPYAKKLSYSLILEVAQASHQGKKNRKEFIKLVKKAKSLERS